MKRTVTSILVCVCMMMAFVYTGCKSKYGQQVQFGDCTIYYADKVDRSLAINLGVFLMKADALPLDRPSTYQIMKEGNTWQVRLVTKTGIQNDQSMIERAKEMCRQFSSVVFSGQPVEIHLCDQNLKTVTTVVP